jgi:Arc/MetJ family transcription regulator
VTKTLIDIDDELLTSAGAALGTSTKRATVEAALREVLDRRHRLAALDQLRDMDFLGEMTDPRFEDRAWG